MEAHWHVVHVSSRTEKKVTERLIKNGFLAYLPVQKQLRQWSDRKKWVEMVMLSGYVFVKITEKQHIKVLEVPGVSRFLKHNNKPVIISDAEMLHFQNFIAKLKDQPVEFSSEQIPVGTVVNIQTGHFKGFSGEVVLYKNKRKLIVRLLPIGYFSVELSPDDITILS